MAKSKNRVLFWLKDGVATDKQRETALGKGAQFRNAEFYDPESEEPADEVMGDVPEGAYYGVKGGSTVNPDDDTEGNGKSTSGGSQDAEEEVEVTPEYLGSLLKADLIALAKEEELELTGHEKVDELKEMLMDHYGFQE